MSTKTTNYQFVKPDLDDEISPEQYNGNFDTLDSKLKSVEDSLKTVSDKVTVQERKLAEQDAALEEHNTALSTHSAKLAEQDAKLSEHDTKLSEHDTAIAELNKKVENAGGGTSGSIATVTEVMNILNASTFGVVWDTSNSATALTRLTKDTDPYGLVTENTDTEPVPAKGTNAGSSPFDKFAPWSGMRECNLDESGNVTAWKGDSGFSRGSAYTMVYIPAFWFAVKTNGEKKFFYISSAPQSGMAKHPGSGKYIGRYLMDTNTAGSATDAKISDGSVYSIQNNAKKIGEKWHSYDFATHCALIFLYLVEYADWNCRAKIGAVSAESTGFSTGVTDVMRYHTGTASGGTDGNRAIAQYRGIENLWGGKSQFTDGINVQKYKIYSCAEPSKYELGTKEGYTELGELPDVFQVLIKDVQITENGLFIPKTVGKTRFESTDRFTSSYIDTDIDSKYAEEWCGLTMGNYSSIMGFDATNVVGHSSSGYAGRLICEP